MKDKEDPFEQSINPWTLFFHDPEYEESFQNTMTSNKYFNSVFKLISYPFIIAGIVYRFVTIASAFSSGFIKSGSSSAEMCMMIFQVASVVFELILKWTGKCKTLRWFFIFTMLRTLLFAAAFYTHNQPVFGIPSTMGFSLIFPVSLMFLRTWIATAISGIIVSIYVTVDYLRLFSSLQPPLMTAMNLILLLLSVCCPSIFSFAYEKGYRKLYFMERETKKNKQRWKSTLDCLPVGIILTTPDNKPEFINKEAIIYLSTGIPLSSRKAKELIKGQSSSLTVPTAINMTSNALKPDDQANDMESLDMIADASGTTLKTAIETETGKNSSQELPPYNMRHAKTNKVYEVKTKLTNYYKIAVVKDQTVYVQLVKEQILQKYLRMLLASISHEVRNPLNAIAGYVSLISETTDISCIKSNITRLQYAANCIDYIVNGACYLVMSDENTIILQPEKFNLVNTVKEVMDMMSCSIDREKVTLALNVAEDIPDAVFSDQGKYKLILFNLLVNAIKYTQLGSITVDLSFDSDTSLLSTIVTDTGCGIKDEKLAGLFQLYAGIDSSNVYNPQGMGLGLTLCKKLTKTLGGEISVSSKVGEGSAFTFIIKSYGVNEIRRGSSDAMSLAEEGICIGMQQKVRLFIPKPMSILQKLDRAKEPCEKCKCTKALVVDDEVSNRLVIRSYLQSLSITVDEAENGLVALEKVERKSGSDCCKNYSLILMDINMPMMDGTTATEKLIKIFKGNKALSAPIVAVTAANLHSRMDIQALLSVGFADILQKPVSKKEFISRVRSYLT